MLKKYIILLTASTSVVAVKFGNPSFTDITVGKPFNITWSDAVGSVAISLKNGPATSLQDVETIASGLSGTSFSWTPSSSLSNGPYALQITDSTGPNYSVQFTINGASSLSSAVSSKSSTMSSVALATTSTSETSISTPSVTSRTTVSSTVSTKSATISSTTSSAHSTQTTSNTSTTRTTQSNSASSSAARPTASTNAAVHQDSNAFGEQRSEWKYSAKTYELRCFLMRALGRSETSAQPLSLNHFRTSSDLSLNLASVEEFSYVHYLITGEMDTVTGTDARYFPSEDNGGFVVVLACDLCYQRKIRCDKKMPCGNCADSRLPCTRDRRKIERKPRERREPLSKDVSEVLYQIKERLTSLETSFSQFVSSSTHPEQENSRKRTHLDAFGKTSSTHPSPFGSSVYSSTKEVQDPSTPPFSVQEGHFLIERELTRQPNIKWRKLTVLKSALAALKQSLDDSAKADCSIYVLPVDTEPIDPKIPDLSLIQWMLQSTDNGRPVYSGSGFMPFVSRKTIGRMARVLLESPADEPSNLAALICVAGYAGYFLHEIVLSKKGGLTGFEEVLRAQAVDYLNVARVKAFELMETTIHTLDNLQALSFGCMLAQEAGDFAAAWAFTGATSAMCLSLNLHKNYKTQSDWSQDNEIEAYYCFVLCYKNDKGLAMNLNHVPYLQDDSIDGDRLRPLGCTGAGLDNFCLYVELAKVQSVIITEVRSACGRKAQQQEALARVMRMLDEIWMLNEQLRLKDRGDNPEEMYGIQMSSNMAQFAFFSIKTVALHSTEEPSWQGSSPNHRDALTSARLALQQIQNARQCAKLSQYNSAYMKTSFAHWTILYYPFTPFFILFCNVVTTRCISDYNLMKQFAENLSEIKGISDSVAKLHKLCHPFCLLASRILEENDDSDSTILNARDNRYSSPASIMGHCQSRTENTSHSSGYVGTFSPAHRDVWTGGSQQDALQHSVRAPYPGTDLFNDLHNTTSEPFSYGNWDFMGVQPMLQWLDSDFTRFEQTWETMGMGDGHFQPQ